MIVRKFREADMALITPRREFSKDPSMDEWLYLACQGRTYTIAMDSGMPVMVLGCNILWQGVAQVWTVPTEHIRGNGLYAVRTTRSLLIGHALTENIRRFHCIIHSGIPENIKWIELLGFEREGIMYRATPDKMDIYVYVNWFEDLLEVGYERWSKENKTRLQGDVAKLFGLDSRGKLTSREATLSDSCQTGDAGGKGRVIRLEHANS